MAKSPTEGERSVTVRAPMPRVYEYLWDVVGSSKCIDGLKRCKRTKAETSCFEYAERSPGPIWLTVRYTVRYDGNGRDRISFQSLNASGDHTDVTGSIRLEETSPDSTRIVLRQSVAPETPIPSLMQGMIRSVVEREAGEGVRRQLMKIKKVLDQKS